MRFPLSEQEYAAVRAAAEEVGLAVGAYAGLATVAAATRSEPPEWSPLRELLGEVMRARTQVRRIGVNLNQSVAALHALGEPTEALQEYARVAAATVQRLDELAEELRRSLR